MNDDFMAAMRRSLASVRAGDPMGATRSIQSALNGTEIAEARETTAPKRAASRPKTRRPSKAVEDAEIVEEAPPRRRRKLSETLEALRRPAPATDPVLQAGARFERRHHACAEGARDLRLYVPASAAEGAAGLLVMLHGCTQTPEDFATGTAMNIQAERHRLIVAYPGQARGENAQGCWNWFRPQDQGQAGESAVIASLATALAGEFGIAPGRTFVAGLSAGGAMAAIAGEAHPEVFAGAGIHSGLAPGAARDMPSAFAAMREGAGGGTPSVPTILFHGSADRTVAPGNSERLAGLEVASRSGTAGGRRYEALVARNPAGHPVELWRIAGAGHAWSGGDPRGSHTDAGGPDASAEMVRFFLSLD